MACQPPHWVRRNASPAKQGPVKATVPVSLMRQSPGSPTKNTNKRGSPTKSPTIIVCNKPLTKKSLDRSPGSKAEKSKTLNFRTQPQETFIRRTASLDAIYLASQWQPDAIFLGYCGRLMIDKATQTPEEWEETEKLKLQRKAVTSGEQLEVKYIRQKLQRTNHGGRTSGSLSSQRQSPVQGDHSAILTNNSLYGSTHHSTTLTVGTHHTLSNNPLANSAIIHHSGPIPILHGPKSHVTRMQNSVEGLNQEIEKIVLKECYEAEREGEHRRFLEPTPEGHRAPIAELFYSSRNEESNTPFAGRDSCPSSGTASRSHSISPVIPIIPGNPEFSVSPPSEDAHKLGTSPHINQFLERGPPDGCEKVKVVDEPRKSVAPEQSPYSTLKPQVKYVLLPSQSSAFCPLYKELNPSNPPFDSFTIVSSTQTSEDRHQ